MRRTSVLALLAAVALAPASAPLLAGAGKNLVLNPSFEESGDDPVPEWHVRKVAGRTTFRIEEGRLVAERTAGSAGSPDECLQTIYLPPETRALRLRVSAAIVRVVEAEIALRMKDSDGGPIGRLRLFALRGTRPEGPFERDLVLPEGTRDVELSFSMRGQGRILVDEVDVRAIDPEDVRPEARIVDLVLEGGGSSSPPPVTETQCPVAVSGGAGSVSYRVVVVERPDFPDLPATIPLTPARHLPRRDRVEPAGPVDPAVARLAAERLADAKDLRELAGRLVAVVSGASPPLPARSRARAEFAASLLLACGASARPVALVPLDGEGPTHAVEVATRGHGWLRFGLAREDPRPLPFSSHVELAWPEGADAAGPTARAEEAGAVVLPDGAGPELMEALAKAWERTRREPGAEVRIDPERVDLRGKAKKLAERLGDLLGSQE